MKTFRIQEKDETTLLYLEVSPHYIVPAEGKRKEDAVLFEMGQHGENGHRIDSVITCQVEDAKAFARSILEVCKKIEEK